MRRGQRAGRGGWLAVLAAAHLGGAGAEPALGPGCGPVELPVASVEDPPTQYAAFCAETPAACRLTGAPVIALDPGVAQTLRTVNAAVNAAVTLEADDGCHGAEDVWSLPRAGYGDCEDYALEKRRRLGAEGLPTAALTMAIVHHRTGLFAHAVLLAETDAGTLTLDNLTDDILCWSSAPYDFERRERPDGRWVRFER